jgi:hypothetical protein
MCAARRRVGWLVGWLVAKFTVVCTHRVVLNAPIDQPLLLRTYSLLRPMTWTWSTRHQAQWWRRITSSRIATFGILSATSGATNVPYSTRSSVSALLKWKVMSNINNQSINQTNNNSNRRRGLVGWITINNSQVPYLLVVVNQTITARMVFVQFVMLPTHTHTHTRR